MSVDLRVSLIYGVALNIEEVEEKLIHIEKLDYVISDYIHNGEIVYVGKELARCSDYGEDDDYETVIDINKYNKEEIVNLINEELGVNVNVNVDDIKLYFLKDWI